MTTTLSPRAADAVPSPSDRSCVVAFHLAVLEAIRASAKHGCIPITIVQVGPGDYVPLLAPMFPEDIHGDDVTLYPPAAVSLSRRVKLKDVREVCTITAPGSGS